MTLDRITSDPCLLAVILFGSHARGDADPLSDRDICAFVRPRDYSHLEEMRGVLEQALHVESDALAIYPASVVQEMAEAGSLFLWHLRLEGRILFDRNDFARDTFASLAVFSGYAEELHLFDTLLLDVEAALVSDGVLTEIDLHLLHSITRNICILLTSYSGTPAFGRASSVSKASSLYRSMPYDGDDFEQLCRWHLAYLRGTAVPGDLPDTEVCRRYVSRARAMVRFAEEILR